MLNFDTPSTPEKISENEKIQERKRVWEAKVREVRNRLDEVEGDMDEKVIETVAALNLFGIATSQSCEGHLDRGLAVPWIMVEAPDRPSESYEMENQTLARVAAENGITIKQLKQNEEFFELLLETEQKIEKNVPKAEYSAWCKKNAQQRSLLEGMVENYYLAKQVETPEELRIKFAPIDQFFRIFIGSQADYDLDLEKLGEQERDALAVRLSGYQQELKNFTDFLRKKFEGNEAVIPTYEAEKNLEKEIIQKMNLPVEKKMEIVLILSQKKPATDLQFCSETWLEGQPEKDIDREQIKKLLDDFRILNLHGRIERDELQEIDDKDDDGKETTKTRRIFEIYVAKNEEDLTKMEKACSEDNHDAKGEIFGFPESARVAFDDLSKGLFRGDLPVEIKGEEWYPYITFGVLSKDNWQAELETAKDWMETVKQFDPELHREYIAWARTVWLPDELGE